MNVCRKKKCLFVFLLLCIVFSSAISSAQDLKRPPVIGIAFVQLQVSDINRARIFYQELMGYKMLPAASTGNNKNHSFTININQRQSIQLQDGLSPGQDERLMGIAFQTSDAEAFRLYLQSKSIPVPAAVTKRDGILIFTVNDPDKHPVSFVQYIANVKVQPQNIMPSAISRRILHAGVTIASASAASTFYADILGFSEIWRGGANDSITSWINMRVPEGTDYLEYMLVNGPVNRQQLGSMHHIALMVPDMQQAVDTLGIRSGITKYTVAAPRIGRNNRWQLNLFDPDGTRIELMEPFTMR